MANATRHTPGTSSFDKVIINTPATGDNILTPMSVTFTVSADVGDAVTVTGQVKDGAGVDMATAVALPWYYSTDAAGLDAMTTAHDGGSAIGTDGSLIEQVANLSGILITEADGDFDIIATDAGAFTSYLVIVMPDGSLQISTVMTHEA